MHCVFSRILEFNHYFFYPWQTFVWILVISMILPEKWIVTIHTEKQWFDHSPAIVSNWLWSCFPQWTYEKKKGFYWQYWFQRGKFKTPRYLIEHWRSIEFTSPNNYICFILVRPWTRRWLTFPSKNGMGHKCYITGLKEMNFYKKPWTLRVLDFWECL